MSIVGSLFSTLGAVAHATLVSAKGQIATTNKGKRRVKKSVCTPCEAMARVDNHRDRVRGR